MTIRELREKYNMTQAQFAEATGVPFRTLQGWDCGRRNPPEYIINLIKFKLDHIKE